MTLILRPSRNLTRRAPVMLTPATYEQLETIARNESDENRIVPISEILRRAIREYLERQNKK